MAKQATDVLIEQRGAVRWIVFNRPEAMNALTDVMLEALERAFREAARAEDVRAIVLAGRGRAFQAGQDLSALGEAPEPETYGALLKKRYHPVLRAMRETPKPILAAVGGVAAGAGMSLALAADFRVMSDRAAFVPAFFKLALVPDTGMAYFLPRLVGFGRALEWMTLGGRIGPDEALRTGLVHRVFPADGFESAAQAFAETLAALPTKTFGMLKRLLQKAEAAPLGEALAYERMLQSAAAATEDHRRGMTAFFAKTEPTFTGR
ncbi:enoyl-CoA hydratase-related protein [Hydrogenibacillus schlegelii]|uniref:enoyl-CoA hydratase/isomerase family protein n=1 Tax=Hydrogenibacillus TaxID=1609627 RepID=UPI000A7FB72B|nr:MULTISPECIES: enoyl-CoA hydratase-related protein [Hydrogenibacillus]